MCGCAGTRRNQEGSEVIWLESAGVREGECRTGRGQKPWGCILGQEELRFLVAGLECAGGAVIL